MIGDLIQSALDAVLYNDGVYVYWNRKTETEGQDPDEYVVYTINGDSGETFADNKPLIKAASATIRYYYRDNLLDIHAGRQKIKARRDTILSALEAADISVPNGPFDAGDIDDIGFGTIVFECEYWRAV